jgi:hypothetical protein
MVAMSAILYWSIITLIIALVGFCVWLWRLGRYGDDRRPLDILAAEFAFLAALLAGFFKRWRA